jgi:RNA polymerase sigma factor (sigma-70 family)
MITKQHVSLVYHLAKTFNRKDVFDDLVSEGFIALVRCANRYQGDKAQLHSYAYHRIKGTMIDYLSTLHEKDEGIHHDYPSTCDIQSQLERKDLLQSLYKMMQTLTQKQRYAVSEYYLQGERLNVIGKRMGVSEGRASQLVRAGVKRLKECVHST